MLGKLKEEMQNLANPEKAKQAMRYFKTGEGEYGHGDIFLGIMVPQQREIAKKFLGLSFGEIQDLLSSKIHEHRLTALFILIDKFKKTREDEEKKEIFDFYLKNTQNINNWDLVDSSSPYIVGGYLLDKNREILYKLAKSGQLWEKRIAILATLAFIKNNEFKDTLEIAEIMLHDKHELIHKAAGWMLREIGKRNQAAEEEFLKKYCKNMPRTMLRYSIEKFTEAKRKFYLNSGKI